MELTWGATSGGLVFRNPSPGHLAVCEFAEQAGQARLSAAVLDAVEREAPQAAARAGVDLRRVRAQFLHVQDIEGGVSVQDAEMTGGGITISSVRGTGGPDPNR